MKKKEITIKDLAEILFPKLWIVVIVSILVSAFTFVYSSFLKDDTYTDSSLHYVFKPDNTGTEITTGDNLSVAQGMVEIYKVMLEGEIFLKKVVVDIANDEAYAQYKDITKGITINAIRSMMNVSQYNETAVFSISITSGSPELSCVILKAIYNNLNEDQLQDIIPNTFKISSFKAPTEPENAKSIAPNSKHTVRNTLLAFMISAVVVVVAIWVYSFFDVIIRDRKKLSDNIDIPILGVIPRHDLPTNVKGDDGNV